MTLTRYMNTAEIPAESAPAQTTYFSSGSKHLDIANQALSAVDADNQHLHIDNLAHQDSGFELSNQERYALFDSQGMGRDFIRRHIREERKSFSSAEQHQLALIASRHMLAEIQQQNAQHVPKYSLWGNQRCSMVSAQSVPSVDRRSSHIHSPACAERATALISRKKRKEVRASLRFFV